jgi:hypothetical protein
MRNCGPAGPIIATPSPEIHVTVDPVEASMPRPAPATAGPRQAFFAICDGARVELPPATLRALQAMALDTLQELFTNSFGKDEGLKRVVRSKQHDYAQVRREGLAGQVLSGLDVRDRQLECLRFVLRTFQELDPSDTALRRAVFGKLGELGRRRDIDAVLPHARKGNASDLHHGLECVRAITQRRGSPQERGGLAGDPRIGPLLRRDRLSERERRDTIEAVLRHGAIVGVERQHGRNLNEVYFVTFAETVADAAGRRRQVRGVFKPERTHFGKERASFSREVASYELDKRFAKTGLIPPTVEALIDLDGRGCSVGSLQLFVEDTRPLGRTYREYDPYFDHLRSTERFQKQEAQARTLLFVLGDPDKLPSDARPEPNLCNLLVDRRGRLWLIDGGFSLGVPPRAPGPSLLPRAIDAVTYDNLRATSREQVEALARRHVTAADAHDAGRRLGEALQHLAAVVVRS